MSKCEVRCLVSHRGQTRNPCGKLMERGTFLKRNNHLAKIVSLEDTTEFKSYKEGLVGSSLVSTQLVSKRMCQRKHILVKRGKNHSMEEELEVLIRVVCEVSERLG